MLDPSMVFYANDATVMSWNHGGPMTAHTDLRMGYPWQSTGQATGHRRHHDVIHDKLISETDLAGYTRQENARQTVSWPFCESDAYSTSCPNTACVFRVLVESVHITYHAR